MVELTEQQCRKCGSSDLWTSWHEDGHACSYAERWVEGIRCCGVDEHLHRGCRNCRFTWREKTRDVETAVVPLGEDA